ncbi:MAG: hypothetical protein QW728_02775, partial [Thermoplasmata archaeon]
MGQQESAFSRFGKPSLTFVYLSTALLCIIAWSLLEAQSAAAEDVGPIHVSRPAWVYANESETVVLPFNITNNYTLSRINIDAWTNSSWTIYMIHPFTGQHIPLPAYIDNVLPDSTITVNISVEVPSWFYRTQVERVNLNASIDSTSYWSFNYTWIVVNRTHSAEVSKPFHYVLNATESTAFIFNIRNTGDGPDTFFIRVKQTYNWPLVYSNMTPELMPGDSYNLSVTVTVPAGTPEGFANRINVTVQTIYN